MSELKNVSEEIKKVAMDKTAQIKVYQLFVMIQIIDIAMTKGSFKGSDASQVGQLYDMLVSGVNQSYLIAERELSIKNSEETKESENGENSH